MRTIRGPLDAGQLRKALGVHAPATLVRGSPQVPLGRGALVTVEPGGQVELSGPPGVDPPADRRHRRRRGELISLLLDADLVPGDHGLDAYSSPRILTVPRYAAMEAAFQRLGARSTDDVQHRRPADLPRRRRSGSDRSPLAGPARSRRLWSRCSPIPAAAPARTPAGRPPGPRRPSAPAPRSPSRRRSTVTRRRVGPDGDGSASARLRRGDTWDAPAGLTFGAWADGALPGDRATYDDLDYHLSTLFPPVRPRGYLEVRYLDAQTGDGWIAPTLLLTRALSGAVPIDQVLAAAEPPPALVPGRREARGQVGPRRRAHAVVELGTEVLDRTGVDPELSDQVATRLHRIVDDTTHGRRAS